MFQKKMCALGVRSKLSLIRYCETETTSDQTEIRPLSRLLSDHGTDQIQIIVQAIVRLKQPLIRPSPDQECYGSSQDGVYNLMRRECLQ